MLNRLVVLAVLGSVAGCAAMGEDAPVLAADTLPVPFADSVLEVWVRGNDGSDPGDVLLVGQTSRLVPIPWWVGRGPGGRRLGEARDAPAARLRWRTLTPAVIEVEAEGRVRALAPGSGGVEVAAFIGSSDRPLAADTMPFRVLPADSSAIGPRFADVSLSHGESTYQTCGITATGRVACLYPPDVRGPGAGEEPGPGLRELAAPPEKRFHALAAGTGFVCALDEHGLAYCWGRNEHGELGHPGPGGTGIPRPAETAARFTRLTAGEHACGLTAGGDVLCWGLSLGGSLGPAARDLCSVDVVVAHRRVPEPMPCSRTPRRVPLPGPAVDVAAGSSHTCALLRDGALYCWGEVYNGGFRSSSPRRMQPSNVRLVTIASGASHVCGLDARGAPYCWGRNWGGQLGAAAPVEGTRVLVRVRGAPPLRTITAGGEHTCGIARTGKAYCWGHGRDGQLGGGTVVDAGPTRVAGNHPWSVIAAGADHTCGLTVSGALYCWGSGLAFRWEPGSFHEQPEPFAVSGWQ